MKTFLFLLFVSSKAFALSTDIPVDVKIEKIGIPLRTTKVWELFPSDKQAHLRRYLLERLVTLEGIETVKGADHRYRAKPSSVSVRLRQYQRGIGNGYHGMNEFPCEGLDEYRNLLRTPKDPILSSSPAVSRFLTYEGAEKALAAQTQFWEKLIRSKLMNLVLRIQRVNEPTEEALSLSVKRQLFRWMLDLETEAEKSNLAISQEAEVKYHLEQIEKQGICKNGISANSQNSKKGGAASSGGKSKLAKGELERKDRFTLEEIMEVPALEHKPELIFRAPSTVVGGLYTVRLSLTIAGRRLNGRFLIDPIAEHSAISPTFLRDQGIMASRLEDRSLEPQVYLWSGYPLKGFPAKLDAVQLGVEWLPSHAYYVLPTDIFFPPEYDSSCCDGVIGKDILFHYAVEFIPAARIKEFSAVRFYKRTSFYPGEKYLWVEASQFWKDMEAANKKLNGNNTFGPSDTFSVSSASLASEKAALWEEVFSRGPLILDLGNGRIWFDRKAGLFSVEAELANRNKKNDLRLSYEFIKGRRHLKVKKLAASTRTTELLEKGLKEGDTIDKIEGEVVGDLSQSMVDRILEGRMGHMLQLEWRHLVHEKLKSAEAINSARIQTPFEEIPQEAYETKLALFYADPSDKENAEREAREAEANRKLDKALRKK